jgi:phosphoglucomutase
VDLAAGNALMEALRARLASLPGQTLLSYKVAAADDFAYHDPVDGSDSKGQGVRILFEGGSRIVYRLSGTGTVGATIRIYLEKYEPPSGDLGEDAQVTLADLIKLSREVSEIEKRTGRSAPSVIT